MVKRKKKKSPSIRLLSGTGRLLWRGVQLGGKGISLLIKKGYDSYKTHQVQRKEERDQQRRSKKTIYEAMKLIKTLEGDWALFDDLLCKNSVGLVLGGTGQGKTAVSLKLLENLYAKTKRRVMALGFKKEDMPAWIEVINDIKDIDHGAFVVVDEGGITLGSRNSMTNVNKLFSELLFIRRHKDLSLLFIVQNSGNIDVNVVKQSDYLIFKKFALLQGKMERKVVMDVYNEVKDEYTNLYNQHGQGLTYIYSEAFRGFLVNPLPSFWNDKVSKGFR